MRLPVFKWWTGWMMGCKKVLIWLATASNLRGTLLEGPKMKRCIVFLTISLSSNYHVSWCLLLFKKLMDWILAIIDFSIISFTKANVKYSVVQMEQILEEHTDEVWFLQFSHDGKYLASSSKDQSAIIWEVSSLNHYWLVVGGMDFYLPGSFSSIKQC